MFAIMRCKKLKSMGNAAASFKHNFREQETLNADPEMSPDNEHLVSESTSEAMGALRERLPEKRRKDAVIGVEYLMTASPEWFETATDDQQKQFFDRSLQWLESKYGKENIVSASIHRDETTPHMSAVVVPLTSDGRLSAKEMIGNQQTMKDDQTQFAKRVQDLGLRRGVEGSKAKHQTIQSYYRKLNDSLQPLTVTEAAVKPSKAFLGMGGENHADVAERLTSAFTDRIQAFRAKALAHDEILKKNEVMQSSLLSLREEHRNSLKQLSNELAGFTGLSVIPDDAKDDFQKTLREASNGSLARLYDKYQMDFNYLYVTNKKEEEEARKDEGYVQNPEDMTLLHKAYTARFVINSLSKKSYYDEGIGKNAMPVNSVIRASGSFPAPQDTPREVLLRNPHHAERLSKESESRIAAIAARQSRSTGGMKR
ncbi:TPA: MobV family relaxase [Yersinia enterocolitica]